MSWEAASWDRRCPGMRGPETERPGTRHRGIPRPKILRPKTLHPKTLHPKTLHPKILPPGTPRPGMPPPETRRFLHYPIDLTVISSARTARQEAGFEKETARPPAPSCTVACGESLPAYGRGEAHRCRAKAGWRVAAAQTHVTEALRERHPAAHRCALAFLGVTRSRSRAVCASAAPPDRSGRLRCC